jgi:IS5 family transposase
MESLTETFCLFDDFCKAFEEKYRSFLLSGQQRKRLRKASASLSEIMTLVVLFHQGRYRHFKSFYLNIVKVFLKQAFPTLPSYNRFLELMPSCNCVLVAFFNSIKGTCTGISFADSTPIAVCENLRISRHKVFKGLAERGMSSTGWYYGFKLHLVINPKGEIIAAKFTAGNIDDRKALYAMKKELFGAVYADKGYLSKPLHISLLKHGIRLVTRLKKNMKPVQFSAFDTALLKCRALIETVNDQLKNLSQIEHTRHRSYFNFTVNLMAGIIAYCLQPKKPSIKLNKIEQDALKPFRSNIIIPS